MTPESSRADAAEIMASIRRIARAIDTRSKRISRETGLTIPQIVVLQAVRDLGEVTTAALARHVMLSAPTTVTILDNLEQKGLVTRTRSDRDRRIVHTALTAEGARTLEAAPALFHERFAAAFAALPQTRQRDALKAFRTVADLLDPGEAEKPA